jgi:inorganic triphosphatase YgiF
VNVSTTETELKLAASDRALRRLRAHRLLRGSVQPVTTRLHSIYFDTPARDLWRRGIALRVRREAYGWVQGVKGGGTAQAGLHQRLEFETPVTGPQPDCNAITDPVLANVFASARVRERLRPVFLTEIRRSIRVLELDAGTLVEASIDRGEIRAGKRSEPVSEIELELKSGEPWRLHEHALRLSRVAPLRVENRSKAERGYALARRKRTAPVKARAPAVASAMRVGEAFATIVAAALGHLQANELGAMAGHDPEYLHQMRVALRRMRSAFRVFAPVLPEAATCGLVTEMRWLARALGPARDWNVFMSETLPPVVKAFAGHAGLAGFAGCCAREERAATRRAQRAVASLRYQRMLLTLGAWLARQAWRERVEPPGLELLDGPVTAFAVAVLEKRYAVVRKRGRRLDRQTPGELHRLRIAIKKLRYATDFFGALFPHAEVRRTLSRLARLQDILGAMNDAITAGELARQALGEQPEKVTAEAYGIVIGWGRARAASLRDDLHDAWHAYRGCGRCWRT